MIIDDMEALPQEVLEHIASFLSASDLGRLVQHISINLWSMF